MNRLRRCVYCGRPTWGRVACPQHRDLLLVDPHYAPELRNPDPDLQDRPPRKRRVRDFLEGWLRAA